MAPFAANGASAAEQPPAERAASLLEAAEDLRWFPESSGLEKAVDSAKQALAIGTEMQDGVVIADALHLVASIMSRMPSQNALEDASVLVGNQLKTFAELGDRRGEAVMKLSMAEINADRRGTQQREDALSSAQEALMTFRDMHEKRMEAKALSIITIILVKKCDAMAGPKVAKQAIKFANEAVTLFRELSDRRNEAAVLFALFCAKMHAESPLKDGLKVALEAVAIHKQQGTRWWQAVILNTVATWFNLRGRGTEGLMYAKEANEIFQDIGNRGIYKGWAASSLSTMMNAHADKNEAAAALDLAIEGSSKAMETAAGDKFTEALSKNVLASAHLLNNDPTEALEIAEESLTLYREAGDRRSEARLLHEMGEMQSKANDVEKALALFEQSASISEDLGDKHQQAETQSAVVMLRMSKEEYKEALEVAFQAIALYEESPDLDGKAITLLNVASCQAALQEFDVALKTAEEAKSIFRNIENKTHEAESWRFLADIQARAEKHEEAVESTTKARVLYQRLGDKVQETALLQSLAQHHISGALRFDEIASRGKGNKAAEARMVKRSLAAALKAGKESLSIAKKLGNQDPTHRLLINSYTVVGQVLGMTGKYEEALQTSQQALKLSQDVCDRSAEANTLISIGQIHNCNSKQDEAKSVLQEALKVAQQAADEQMEAAATEILSNLDPQASGRAGGNVDVPGEGDAKAIADDAAAGDHAVVEYAGPSLEAITEKLTALAMSVVVVDELAIDEPLMDSGLDSLSMVQFRNTMAKEFPGVGMPASVVFDYPTVRALAGNIDEELKAAHAR